MSTRDFVQKAIAELYNAVWLRVLEDVFRK